MSKFKQIKDIFFSAKSLVSTVQRKRSLSEDKRKEYATELLDTYLGFGMDYIKEKIDGTIKTEVMKREMLLSTVCLTLLQYFTNSISRVYKTQPVRRFYLDDKEILKQEDEEKDAESYVVNEDLMKVLNDFYNPANCNSIKDAEKFTNLLNTTIYKVITDELGVVKLVFIPNDTVQVIYDKEDITRAQEIAFIQEDISDISVTNYKPIIEKWNKFKKEVPSRDGVTQDEESDNEASKQYLELFETQSAGEVFAPFVKLKDSGSSMDFWNIKNKDVLEYIKSINVSLTELKYLEKYTSFGLKYGVNVKFLDEATMSPQGFVTFAVENSTYPGDKESGKNFEIGEFANRGSIDEVIRSIVFSIKMLFSIYSVPLDALISSNSVRSAENKEVENKELLGIINSQRDIWQGNEQNIFKVMQAVHNRDNQFQIPKGVTMVVDFEEQKTAEKEAEDWLVEIENNISTAVDWLASQNPDLDRDQVLRLFKSNKDINDIEKELTSEEDLFKNDEEDSKEEDSKKTKK